MNLLRKLTVIVVTSKEFRGQMESTHLSRTFSDQGVRLRLRKEQRTITGYVFLAIGVWSYLRGLERSEDMTALRIHRQHHLSRIACNLEHYTREVGTAARLSVSGRIAIIVLTCPTHLNSGRTTCTNMLFNRTLSILHKGLRRRNQKHMVVYQAITRRS